MIASAMRPMRRGQPAISLRQPTRCYGGLLFLLTVVLALCAGCGDSAGTPSPVALTGAPATGPAFQSGGIGLTKAAWEQHHTPSSAPFTGEAFVWYPDNNYEVYFWHDWPLRAPTADSLISTISFDTRAHTLETQRVAYRPLLPADAQLEPKISYPDREIWYSPSLISRYPPLAGDPQVWGEFGPGRISVRSGESGSYIAIGALLNGPPKPTEVIPVRPTPTPCGDHPCPTTTYALPTPVPTAIRAPLPLPPGTTLLPTRPAPIPSLVPPLVPTAPVTPSRSP